MRVFALGGAAGAALAYFFDPQNGRRRRHLAFDRTAGFFRSGGRQAARAGRGVAAEAYGVSQKVQHLTEEPKDYDDATLADKIRSQVFRDPDIPKGALNVNVQNGVAQLRGEVPRADLIEELVAETRRVQGVRDVENLLHVPGTRAPMHQ
jgi:osmotically-inducible protein OsmY